MSPREVRRFARMAIEKGKQKWGDGWVMLSPAMRADAIAARVPEIAFQWDSADDVPATVVTAIWLEALKLEKLDDL